MKNQSPSFLTRYAVALCWVYFTILFGWLIINLIFREDRGYLDIVNNLAVYLFFPLPLIALITGITRRRELIGGTILAFIAFIGYWGNLFIPSLNPPRGGNPHAPLTVMTYNVLGLHDYVNPVIDVIRTEDADVVCLQEVNSALAVALQSELATEYPYQNLDPQEGVNGMGTLSRLPFKVVETEFPLVWVGTPQILELDFEGVPVILVNFHAHPYSFGSRSNYLAFQEHRQKQSSVLLSFSKEIDQPLIMAGDTNDTSLSGTYHTVTSGPMVDVWQEAGFGLGHTFPGSDIPGSSRWKIGPWYVPQWLTRIDYIFVSPHWEVISARVAQFDGVSDHRGVVAELVLK
jgi:endonuclease/exonuclease/phosphatase (EEP) superfamily protein YafD